MKAEITSNCLDQRFAIANVIAVATATLTPAAGARKLKKAESQGHYLAGSERLATTTGVAGLESFRPGHNRDQQMAGQAAEALETALPIAAARFQGGPR